MLATQDSPKTFWVEKEEPKAVAGDFDAQGTYGFS